MAKTNYQELTQYNSPNYTPKSQVPYVYGMPRTIDGIIFHWWGDPAQNPQFLNIVNFLCRANGNTSAHLVGESGRVAWIVDAVNAAWHAGNARGNATQVGYECNPRLAAGDYQTMGEFLYDMEKAYGKTLPITVHKQWSSTACSPIDLNRIRSIANALHKSDSTPAPAPAKWVAMAKPRTMVAAVDLYVRNLDSGKNQGDVIKKGTKIDFNTQKTIGSTTYLRSKYSTSKNLNWGIDMKQLKEVEVAPVPQPEWIRNLKDITDTKLSVLPAAGVKVLNLTTFTPVDGTIIPKGTQIDIAKETTIGGKKYYLSSYAVSKGLPWGIPADQLGVPVVTPPAEKPEWLKNLKDITDKDFWTRSATPVLSAVDGHTVRTLPINTKVRVTHTTEILGADYMVVSLDGDKAAEIVEPVYLSDTEIKNPNEDLEKRVSALEKIVDAIVTFLTNMFKNFNK